VADEAVPGVPLRGDPGTSAGVPPSRGVGNDRHQSGEGRRRQPGREAQGAAFVRVVGGARGDRGGDRAAVRTDDLVRGRDRAAASGVDRTRETRRRSGGACGLRAALLHPGPAEGPKDGRAVRCKRGHSTRSTGSRTATVRRCCFPASGAATSTSTISDRSGGGPPNRWRASTRSGGVYDLRHTFATFALRAGISTFDLSRYMGASLTMIDRDYGHLARDGRERRDHTPRRAQRSRIRPVDAGGRSVDAETEKRRRARQRQGGDSRLNSDEAL
jgi:hypothetical protein